MQNLVFCYGTLKSGFHNNYLLKNSKFVGKAVTKPLYRLYNIGRFPGLVEDAETGKAIQGELWHVNTETLKQLDCLEGVPYLYRREYLQIENVEEEVQGYIFNRDYNDLEECSPVWEG